MRYLFTAQGPVPDGVLHIVQFSDHGIAPDKASHFHLFASNTSHEETLKEMDHWPTYYPDNMSGHEVAQDMMAH
ncbi:ZinT/AdcA family metal-binding protein [Bifidobacterium gallicum]|uniref:YodA n=1 Tax=Bifidobacterium gallicum DSM 20093 = LMG 11596 TaxID=561180 RepID=D1NS14_9BIFI|nr:ZinT/AdcA family metal-binding protein [Bifidobacterium gallicum]EFA23466.1 YodA [Bifidobacterium gallicum DSM 20093 = LMG 11596]KFI57246.1 zinc ABC transporter, zinc-binding lipoprotein [Bifidobacterium gallicum DSM 20093 = LMG 11596]